MRTTPKTNTETVWYAINGRVRIPYQARVSMVVRTRGSPLQVAQAWPNVLDELSLAIWRSTPNSSSLAAVVRLADTLNLDPVH